jgi:hypothetical protein
VTLPESVLKGLGDLLMDCTARITQLDGSLPAGAGFFVSDTLIVTNRHVVGEHEEGRTREVLVQPYGSTPRSGAVLPPSVIDPSLDIALVEVVADHATPAVVLHQVLDRGGYLFAGYPTEDFYTDLKAGLEVADAQGRPRNDNDTTRPQLLRLTDVQIKPGFSGGAVLSTTTGAVVAVTVYTEDQDDDLGGGALTIEQAVSAYPELRRLAAEPPGATQRWREILERPRWEGLGLVWDRDEQVDIYLSGDRSRWRIGTRSDDAGPERTVRDLGDEMTEVLVNWARSSGRRDESEVRLLARLLSAAILPPPVAECLPPPAGRNRDPVLVRLHVDPAGPLADLPWEFATDPSDPQLFLAATDGYAFVRVNPDAPAGRARRLEVRPPDTQLRVLTIVVQPDNTTRWPSVVDTRELIPWPSSADLEAALAASIGGPKTAQNANVFMLETLRNPTLSQLKMLGQQPEAEFDIVHYVGFGYQERAEADRASGIDRSMLACSAGPGGADDLRYHNATELLKAIGEFRPTLVVLEFGTPSLDQPYEKLGKGCQPIGPSLLGAASTLGVDAMVCTRPLHPIQYNRFNEVLYTRLAAGQTVEQAVQLARQALLTDAPIDFAGFGWFMATTGNSTRARYFDGPTRSGQHARTTPAGVSQAEPPIQESHRSGPDGFIPTP